MTEISFMCCFCGMDVDADDDEACQIAVIWPWGDALLNEEPQMFFAHRKPCLEGVLHVEIRNTLGVEWPRRLEEEGPLGGGPLDAC